jgi:folate-binding protein YgfZ
MLARMASPSPLIDLHRRAGATLLAYGPQSRSAGVEPGVGVAPIDLVATYGPLEMEYAAIRRHCGLLDLPSRGLIEVTGPDRVDFLNRMLTQELRPGKNDLPAWSLARSFWLGRTGRVDADLRVCVLPERVLLEVDALAAPRAAVSLASFVVMEDCAVKDVSAQHHCLALHGPTALALLARAFTPSGGAPRAESLPETGGVTEGKLAGAAVVVLREDEAGVPGFLVIASAAAALDIARSLIAEGHDASHATHSEGGFSLPMLEAGRRAGGDIRLSPVGWLAFNIARVEAGTPLFNIDIGTENLPAETGLLESRVSFTKGCYLGQEVVARMHARKQVKQRLVAVAFEALQSASAAGDAASPEGHVPYALLPEQGATLLAGEGESAAPVGRITSSTLSPRRAMAPIALAQVRSAHASPGTVLATLVEGETVKGVVQAGLAFPLLRAGDATAP